MFISRNFRYGERSVARTFSDRRKKGEVKIPDAKRIAVPWNERKGVWKSTFEFFKPNTNLVGPDIIKKLQTPLDLSPGNVRKWYERRIEAQEESNQSFISERFEILGPDLAAAHFIVHRGGAIRFYNEKEWIRRNEKDESYLLPKNQVSGLFVEAIDCKGVNLRTTGLENILDLTKLRWLSLADNPLIDNWSLDSISGSYGETLQYLDISNCHRVTHHALACFYRFRCLDTLIVKGIANSDEFKLSCMLLEDLKPMLTIKGIDHPSPEVTTAEDSTKIGDDERPSTK